MRCLRSLLLRQNTMTKRQVGEERVYLAHTSTLLLITEGSQDRKSNTAGSRKQELMLRPWREDASWFDSHVLLTCFVT